MKIAGRDLSFRVLVVAEIGNNHEGDFETALRLVTAAARAGADAVKFQTFRTARFVSNADPERLRQLRAFELPFERFSDLAAEARRLGLLFFSTPLDLESAAALEPLVDAYKVASGDIDFVPLLERVSATDKPVILSTGASEISEVEEAVTRLRAGRAGRHAGGDLALLHCVSAYPAPSEEANLLSIPFLADRFPGVPVGYSDHTLGITACLAAASLGARIIEKHFTLDKNRSPFRDHALSADPPEFTEMVRRVREVESLLGLREKGIRPSEAQIRPMIRRSIGTAQDLPAGHRLRPEDLAWLRPSGGFRPGQEDRVVGRVLTRPLPSGETIRPDDLEPGT